MPGVISTPPNLLVTTCGLQVLMGGTLDEPIKRDLLLRESDRFIKVSHRPRPGKCSPYQCLRIRSANLSSQVLAVAM